MPDARSFGAKGELALPPARLRDPDLHGCAARPGEVCRPRRGGRACHPQRGRPCQRRRHPLARDLLQAARHEGVVRHPSHRLRYGVLHERDHARPAGRSLETATIGPDRLPRRRRRAGLDEGRYINWLTITRPAAERRRRRAPHPQHPLVPGGSRSTATSTTSDGSPDRGAGGHGGGRARIAELVADNF